MRGRDIGIIVGVIVLVILFFGLLGGGMVGWGMMGSGVMGWGGFGPGFGWWGIVMGIAMLLFWALVIGGVVLLLVWLFRQGQPAATGSGPSANRSLDILRERYARGEISREEYEQRRRDLEGQ